MDKYYTLKHSQSSILALYDGHGVNHLWGLTVIDPLISLFFGAVLFAKMSSLKNFTTKSTWTKVSSHRVTIWVRCFIIENNGGLQEGSIFWKHILTTIADTCSTCQPYITATTEEINNMIPHYQYNFIHTLACQVLLVNNKYFIP